MKIEMAKYGRRIIEKKDYVMMKQFKFVKRYMAEQRKEEENLELEDSIAAAVIYDLGDMPTDIVRLHSQVRVSSEWGWSRVFELVLPYDAHNRDGVVSVDSPLGVAVIGLSEGDYTTYNLLGERSSIKIEKVTQDRTWKKKKKSNIF